MSTYDRSKSKRIRDEIESPKHPNGSTYGTMRRMYNSTAIPYRHWSYSPTCTTSGPQLSQFDDRDSSQYFETNDRDNSPNRYFERDVSPDETACQFPSQSRALVFEPRPGLSNLGNTCYMNASIQCLFHCDSSLVAYFISGDYKADVRYGSPLNGDLAQSFAELCLELNQVPAPRSVEPSQLKDTISRWASQFIGYEQNCAHEFLRFLIDGLGEDLKVNRSNPQILPEERLSLLSPAEQGEHTKLID